MKRKIKNVKELSIFTNELAKKFSPPALFLLEGNLGAGKTAFVKYFCEKLGFDKKNIKSPTFSLINTYKKKGSPIVHHIDLYRLTNEDSVLIEEIKELSNDYGFMFIEWPEKMPNLTQVFKNDKICEITIEKTKSSERIISLKNNNDK